MVANNVQLLENKYTEFPGRFSAIQAKADPNLQIYSDPIYNEYFRQHQSGMLRSKPQHYDIPIDLMKLQNKIYFDQKDSQQQILNENKIFLASSIPINKDIQKKQVEHHQLNQKNSNIQISHISSKKIESSSTQVKIEENQSAPNENSNITQKNVPEISHEQSVQFL